MAKKKPLPPIHPRISPFTVLGLGVVTAGLYSYIWTARRYKEVDDDAGWASHWLVPACVILAAILLSVGFTTVIPFVADPYQAAVASVYGNYALLGSVLIFGTWWMVRYMRRIDQEQQVLPLVFMSFFFSPLAIYYLQMELNERSDGSGVLTRWLAVVTSMVLGVGVFTAIYTRFPIDHEIMTLETEYRLANDYITCHEDLSARYPNDEVGAYQYQAYLDAYEDCEAIVE